MIWLKHQNFTTFFISSPFQTSPSPQLLRIVLHLPLVYMREMVSSDPFLAIDMEATELIRKLSELSEPMEIYMVKFTWYIQSS